MSELTINSIIKIIIAVMIIFTVIFGVYLAFTNYIIPALTGGTPTQYEGPVYSDAALQEILNKSSIGEIKKDEKGIFFIYLNERKTDYYRGEKSEIFKLRRGFLGWDKASKDLIVGKIYYPGDYGVIVIIDGDDAVLRELNNKIVYGSKIYDEEIKG